MTVEVLYEDNHLLAANKPAGMLTQPSPVEEHSLENEAKAYIKIAHDKPGAVWLNAIHRLDRQVSGVVLFARTSKAAARLNEAMRKQQMEKLYWAVTETLPEGNPEGTLEHYLRHASHQAELSDARDSEAKHAILHYRLRERLGPLYLLEVDLVTGRYHQIRAQLAAAGSPVLGDDRYGSSYRLDDQRIALHHRQLRLPHPTRSETITVRANPPSTPPWVE